MAAIVATVLCLIAAAMAVVDHAPTRSGWPLGLLAAGVAMLAIGAP